MEEEGGWVSLAVGEHGTVNVMECGAKGDGATNDTNAVAHAFTLASAMHGTVYFPPGRYRILRSLHADGVGHIRGEGWTSVLLWCGQEDLVRFETEARGVTISHLCIKAVETPKPPVAAAISCQAGATRCLFDHLLISDRDGSYQPGSGLRLAGVTDSTTVRDVQLWGVTGTGIEVGRGSEVRIVGGRIIGTPTRTKGSIGVHVTGNNGGVHIVSTDIISLYEGIRLENASGAGSNREIFLDQATLDSNWRGLVVLDDSYVCISGCWAASSISDNLYVAPGLTGTLLVVTGGTIFNAGVLGGDPTTQCNGLTVHSGSFLVSGCAIRNNKGRGVWVPPGSCVGEHSITGCRIVENGQGLCLHGSSTYVCTSNIYARNARRNDLVRGGVQANNLDAPSRSLSGSVVKEDTSVTSSLSSNGIQPNWLVSLFPPSYE